MRNTILLLVILITHITLPAQTETANSKSAGNQFETLYNDGNYAGIFGLFSPDMQKALPLNKTVEFFTGLQKQAGTIKKRQFVKYQQAYAIYKTNFEQILFAVNISVDSNASINGLLVKPFIDESLPKMERNVTKMRLPFKDEWTVVWGGDTKELNYHVESVAQKNAFDIVITDSKQKSYKTNGKINSDYYAFGKELFAPCAGEIVFTADGIKDNKPGELNPDHILGNAIIIKTAKNEYLFFAHFKQHSIKVRKGQKVTPGQLLGHCGNSGRSSEPHVHFHIQNSADLYSATGIKCYFDKLIVNGKLKNDYSPIQNDKIKMK